MSGSRRRTIWALCLLAAAALVAYVTLPPLLRGRSGRVRVLAVKVREDAQTVHWRWTITGHRRWATFSSASARGGYQITLSPEPDLLQRMLRPSGSSVIHCELTVSRTPGTSPGMVSYTEDFEVMGAGGGIPAASYAGGFSAPAGSLGRTVKVLLREDKAVDLPCTLTLATMAGAPVTVQLMP